MPTFQKQCDSKQGFKMENIERQTVGWVTSLKLGREKLKQTFNPPKVKGSGELKCVAVIRDITWGAERTAPMYISGNIGAKNWAKLNELTLASVDDIVVELEFEVWEYDYGADDYFQSFKTDKGPVKALLQRNEDGSLAVSVGGLPSRLVPSPVNYDFFVGLVPAPVKQNLITAFSTTAKQPIPWGFIEK